MQLIANSDTIIPNLPAGVEPVTFGSTAPPSAAGDAMVFLGLDNEEDPSYGGIYLARLVANSPLTTLVGIGDPVPDELGATFNKLGEGLSFDGRYVGFWGAWGEETITLWLDRPQDGNAELLEYYQNFVGDNFPVRVPAHQGMFVIDTQTNIIHKIADNAGYFSDFLFWGFSGAPPGVGGGEEDEGREPPRWRVAAFLSVAGGPKNTFMAAFKARSGEIDHGENNYLDPVDGIYLSDGKSTATLLDTTMDGRVLEGAAPVGSKIATLGIEREGFRGSWLTLTASMAVEASTEPPAEGEEETEEEGMAGIYTAKMYTGIPRMELPIGKYVTPSNPSGSKQYKPTIIRVDKDRKFDLQLVIDGVSYSLRGRLNRVGKSTLALKGKKDNYVVKLVAANVSGARVLDVAVTGGRTGLNYNELAAYRK